MYIVIELQTNADGSIGNFVWAYEDKDQAFSKYHHVLASAAISALPCHACVILKNDGQQIAAESFEHGEQSE